MPEKSESKIQRNCWIRRTDLEKGLMGLLVFTTILISILGVVLLLSTRVSSLEECGKVLPGGKEDNWTPSENNSESTEFCKTPACLQSASEILNQIDTNTNPCDDFYGFTCNNMLPNIRLNYERPSSDMIKTERSRIEAMYIKPIMTDDHPQVKVQKIMYDACMNETAISEDVFPTLKEVLKRVGGWPILEQQWNPDKFDWVQTSYKLRQLGYHHDSFLELKIVPDPDNAEKYIFEVSIPTVNHIYSKWFDSDENSGFMTDVAIALGAEIHLALKEMTEVYQFLNDLQWLRNSIMDEKTPFQRATVAEFQRREHTMNWLNFINTMAGPDITVSRNDVVLFPPERSLDEWFGLLARTHKRIVANYMLWRVVEDMLPYLTDLLLTARVKPRLMTNAKWETRSQFCIDEIDKRFSPSPINVMYLRKYLPAEKRDAVEEVANNLKLAVLDIVKEVTWLDAEDKKNVAKVIADLSIIVGAPGDYFDDSIFDMKFNMDISTNNFLNLLSQANRNNQDRLYRLIEKSPQNTKIVWADITGKRWFSFSNKENEINILANIVQNPIFNEEQPNYLNYANMGILLQHHLFKLLENADSDQSKEAIEIAFECLKTSLASINSSKIEFFNMNGLITHNFALKVSQRAYKKWGNNKKQEAQLVAVHYTPDQLFWMSSGYLFCKDTVPPFAVYTNPEQNLIFESMLPKIVNSNPDLARDFECSEIPEEICKLF